MTSPMIGHIVFALVTMGLLGWATRLVTELEAADQMAISALLEGGAAEG